MFLFKFEVEIVVGWGSLAIVGCNFLENGVGVPEGVMGGFGRGVTMGELVFLDGGVGLVFGSTSVFESLFLNGNKLGGGVLYNLSFLDLGGVWRNQLLLKHQNLHSGESVYWQLEEGNLHSRH